MRTTVEFPPDLMRAVKARSAELGESLKTLLTRAVAAEIGADARAGRSGSRVVLPLFGSASGRRHAPSNADLERALADDDAGLAAGARRRKSGRHAR